MSLRFPTLSNTELSKEERQGWLGGLPPRTLLGLLALALERRRQTSGAPLTLISCDNVPSNGARLKGAMLKFAALRSAELTRFIEV